MVKKPKDYMYNIGITQKKLLIEHRSSWVEYNKSLTQYRQYYVLSMDVDLCNKKRLTNTNFRIIVFLGIKEENSCWGVI